MDGTVLEFDPRTPEAIADPYRTLRPYQEQAPVFWSDHLGGWCVTRYDDVRNAFRDPRLSSDRIRPFMAQAKAEIREIVKPLGENLTLWMVFNDPPDHTRLRELANKAFTSRAVEALRPDIEKIVDNLLDEIEAKPGREFDFIFDFAYPLPATVIATMLGVPQKDVDLLKKWSDGLAKFVLTSRSDPDRYRVAAEGMQEMTEYFRGFIEDHAKRDEDDITTGLIKARDEGDKLTAEELVAMVVLLLFAGHETTTQMLANGTRGLLESPEQWRDLYEHRDDVKVVRNAVEEVLRWDGPSMSMIRVAGEDFDWYGNKVKQGDRVFLFMCSANRDPRVFDDPDKLDIRRKAAKQNIAFGYGIHFCIGAPLARLEGEIAFPKILERFPTLKLAEADPPWSDSILTRGMLRMPVTY